MRTMTTIFHILVSIVAFQLLLVLCTFAVSKRDPSPGSKGPERRESFNTHSAELLRIKMELTKSEYANRR